MRPQSLRPMFLSLAVGGVVSAATLLGPAAVAQNAASASGTAATSADSKPQGWSYVEKANAAVAVTPGTEDLTPILFPAVAGMDAVPTGIEGVDGAMLLAPKSKGWSAAKSWAESANQQAALKALATVTDPKKKFLLALPYSSGKGADEAIKKAGLYIELPPSGLLQGAKYKYRFALERLVMLVNVEATRRAEEGKPDEALNLCVQWLRLARIVTEREGVRERRWGIGQMMLAAERIRDIAHVYREKLAPEQLRNTADDIDERLVQLRRIRLPLLERLAAEQLMERVIAERGEVNPDKFAVTMARLSADQRALNLFGQAAWYRELSKGHAGWFDTRDQINKVFGGWENRWNVENLHDPLLQIPSDYAKMDKAKFALIELTANEVEGFEGLRLDVLTHLAGTRVALGVVGYERKEKKWPPTVSAISPAYVRALDTDPYGYDKRFKNLNPFLFKVPIRDDVKREREEPKPHEMTVGVGEVKEGSAPAAAPAEGAQATAGSLGGLATLKLDPANPPDAANLRELFRQTAELTPAAKESDLPQYTTILKGLAARGAKPGSIGSAMLPDLSVPSGANDLAGFDVKKLQDQLREMLNAMSKGPKYAAMFEAAQKDALTVALVNESSAEANQVYKDDAIMGPLAETFALALRGPTGPMIMSQLNALGLAGGTSSGAAAPSETVGGFTASVTQKDFLVWSVGPDGVDNQAKSVGSGGNDILIWPPILTLRRLHAEN